MSLTGALHHKESPRRIPTRQWVGAVLSPGDRDRQGDGSPELMMGGIGGTGMRARAGGMETEQSKSRRDSQSRVSLVYAPVDSQVTSLCSFS